jgi:hypothetical protein
MVHRRLGLKLEEQLEALDAEAGMPPFIADRWAATEARRSALQWHPARPGGSAAGGVLGFRQEMLDLAGAWQPRKTRLPGSCCPPSTFLPSPQAGRSSHPLSTDVHCPERHLRSSVQLHMVHVAQLVRMPQLAVILQQARSCECTSATWRTRSSRWVRMCHWVYVLTMCVHYVLDSNGLIYPDHATFSLQTYIHLAAVFTAR